MKLLNVKTEVSLTTARRRAELALENWLVTCMNHPEKTSKTKVLDYNLTGYHEIRLFQGITKAFDFALHIMLVLQ